MAKSAPLVWSPYQQAIFSDVQNGTGNTVVIARAGASKTTSLVECVKYIPKKKKSLFIAFNKAIAVELEERINKSYIEVRTLHSFGCRVVMSAFGKVKIDPNKTYNLSQAVLEENGLKRYEKKKFDLAQSICNTVNLCKSSLIDIPSKIDILIDQYDIDTLELDRDDFIKIVCQVLRKCKDERACIDFSDMIHYPYIFNMNIPKYDRVFLDEGQDMSPAQLHIALSACKKDGRFLAVADDRQVLYSFAGVDINSVDILVKKLNAKILPLPISYRCAKSIVKLAQTIVPDIQSAPNAKDGSVRSISEDIFLSLVKPGDFILSRVNAPLIYYCMELIHNKVRANILGKDVSQGLIYMIKKSEAKTIDEFLVWLGKWKKEEIKRLEDKNRDPILVLDKANCLENLCRGMKSLDQVKNNVKELFNDEDRGNIVRLASIHKSKGLEAKRVFILMNTLRRDMSQSELNIEYVGYTRAMDELYLVR
jgi:superfamily I DNA/RNA helicase